MSNTESHNINRKEAIWKSIMQSSPLCSNQSTSHHSIVGFFQYFSIFCWRSFFCGLCIFPCCWLHFAVSPPYSFRLLFPNQNQTHFFLTQNALEKTAQPQFAYSGPQRTEKPVMCEYMTNQQITCWQGEMQKRVLQFRKGVFWLLVCNFTGIF